MKRKLMFTFWAALSLCEVLHAQNSDSLRMEQLNQLVMFQSKEITQKEGEIKLLQESIQTLQKEINGLQSDKEKADKQRENDAKTIADLQANLKVEKENAKSSKWQEQIKQLQNEKTQLQADYKKLKEESDQKEEQRVADQRTIADLESELNTLKDFKVKWLADLADGVDREWMDRTYASFDVKELESECQRFAQYEKEDGKVKAASVKLNGLLEEKCLYDRGMQTIAQPYEKSKVDQATVKVRELESRQQIAVKKNELHELVGLLENYGLDLEIFQDLIVNLEKLTGGASKDLAWSVAERFLKHQEDEDAIAAIEEIPWLKGQYELYYAALREDCFGPNPARDLIMSLQP